MIDDASAKVVQPQDAPVGQIRFGVPVRAAVQTMAYVEIHIIQMTMTIRMILTNDTLIRGKATQ